MLQVPWTLWEYQPPKEITFKTFECTFRQFHGFVLQSVHTQLGFFLVLL